MVERVMAVDPGKSTGIVVGDFHDDHEFSIIHVQQLKHEHWMSNVYDILATYNEYAPDVVVCEQFDLRPGNNFLADLTPVKSTPYWHGRSGTSYGRLPQWQKLPCPTTF